MTSSKANPSDVPVHQCIMCTQIAWFSLSDHGTVLAVQKWIRSQSICSPPPCCNGHCASYWVYWIISCHGLLEPPSSNADDARLGLVLKEELRGEPWHLGKGKGVGKGMALKVMMNEKVRGGCQRTQGGYQGGDVKQLSKCLRAGQPH